MNVTIVTVPETETVTVVMTAMIVVIRTIHFLIKLKNMLSHLDNNNNNNKQQTKILSFCAPKLKT